jgi:hypothetical protein
MQMQPPERITENLVRDALGFKRRGLRRPGWARRSQHIQTLGCADGVNAEHVRVVADDDQAMQPVDASDDGNAAGRLLSVAALGLSNNGLLRNAFADQISAPTEPSVY